MSAKASPADAADVRYAVRLLSKVAHSDPRIGVAHNSLTEWLMLYDATKATVRQRDAGGTATS